MTSLIVDAATSQFTHQLDPVGANAQEQTLQGHRIIHWSFYVTVGGAVVSAVAAIAALIFSFFPGIVAGALLTATSGLSAHYIKKFSIFKTFEEQEKIYKKRNQELAEQVQRLKEEQGKIQDVAGGMSQSNSEFATMLQNQQKELEEKVNELEQISTKLEKTEKAFQSLQKVCDALKSALEEVSNGVIAFNRENASLEEHKKNISDFVSILGEHKNRFQGEMKELDDQVVEYDRQTDELVEQVDLMEQQLKLMRDIEGTNQKEIRQLREQVESLDRIANSVTQNAQDLQQKEEEFRKIEAAIEEKLNRLKNLEKLVDLIPELRKALQKKD